MMNMVVLKANLKPHLKGLSYIGLDEDELLVFMGKMQFIVTSHIMQQSTKYKYKTGPIAVVDWGDHAAHVIGIFIDVLVQFLKLIELDTPRSNICTDGGLKA